MIRAIVRERKSPFLSITVIREIIRVLLLFVLTGDRCYADNWKITHAIKLCSRT